MSPPGGPAPQSTPFRSLIVAAALLAAVGCGSRRVSLPGGQGTPFAEFEHAYAEATAACRDVRTFAGVLHLSGRVGDDRLRGRVDAGFAEPGRIRLEGLPPALAFGRPIFILVGRGEHATLLLPRDQHMLSGERAEVIIDALTGVALTADELRAAVTGCGFGTLTPQRGVAYEGGWLMVEDGEARSWLRQRPDGAWQSVAGSRGPIEIRYEEYQGSLPSRIRITNAPGAQGPAADIGLRLSDVDINTELGPDVFTVEIPDDAMPLTLDELRRSRPSRGTSAP